MTEKRVYVVSYRFVCLLPNATYRIFQTILRQYLARDFVWICKTVSEIKKRFLRPAHRQIDYSGRTAGAVQIPESVV